MRVIWGSLPRTVFFDDLHILRTLDRLEQAGQTAYLNAGIDLLTEVTGGQPVSEDRDYRSFIRELSTHTGTLRRLACSRSRQPCSVVHHAR
jgi:hypothetical protein